MIYVPGRRLALMSAAAFVVGPLPLRAENHPVFAESLAARLDLGAVEIRYSVETEVDAYAPEYVGVRREVHTLYQPGEPTPDVRTTVVLTGPTWKRTELSLCKDGEVFRDVGDHSRFASRSVDPGSNRETLLQYLFDPRMLGSSALRFDAQHARAGVELPALMEITAKGTAALNASGHRIVSTTDARGTLRLTMIPDCGMNVGSIHWEGEEPRGRHTVHVESELKQYHGPTGSVWFPRRVVHTEQQGDKTLAREVISVSEFKWHQEFSDADFELTALGIPAGRIVITDDQRLNQWNGNRLGSDAPRGTGERAFSEPRSEPAR